MDSRISIKGDFIANTPFVDVVYNPSDDARDEMVKVFAEKLEYTSCWARVDWLPSNNKNGRFNFRIVPISPSQFTEQIKQMEEANRVFKSQYPAEPLT